MCVCLHFFSIYTVATGKSNLDSAFFNIAEFLYGSYLRAHKISWEIQTGYCANGAKIFLS